jgi:hypothetical protein
MEKEIIFLGVETLVSDRANFTITKIEAYKKNFEQKIWSIMAL